MNIKYSKQAEKFLDKKREWDDIDEVVPDEIDLEMMADVETNPDCKEFISQNELIARRMARKSAQ